jgi:site-specific DNA-methyltransferase (adenine-specific)
VSTELKGIRVDSIFQNLIPPLTAEEYQGLEASIIAEGCRDPLITWNGWIVDGHNRHEICRKHDIEFRTVEKEFESAEEAKVWIIDNQKGRRNLTVQQKLDIGFKRAELLRPKAEENLRQSPGRGKKGYQKSDKVLEPVDTLGEAADYAGVSRDTASKYKKIQESADDVLKEKVAAGEISINQGYKEVQKKTKKQEKAEETEKHIASLSETAREALGMVCNIFHCSFEELNKEKLHKLPDCIITDPPYGKEHIDLYEQLAREAVGVPLVAVMCGQSYLPQILFSMSKHLKYLWTIAYLTPGGQSPQIWNAKVNTFWKPVLLFGELPDWIGDVCKSEKNEKEYHKWGQSESGMSELIHKLTKPGQLICDPFVGGGATAVAALKLGRRFVGCDIDFSAVEISNRRCEALYESA